MNNTYILHNNLVVESPLSIDTNIFSSLEQALILVQERLQAFAGEPEFTQKIAVAFGDTADADSLKTAWLAGDLSIAPTIAIRNAADINGANGAYGAFTNKIYLSWEFLQANQANPENLVGLLLEEIGHRVDSVLNSSDSPGDEGAIFSALVQGEILSVKKVEQLKQQQDVGQINLNGQIIEVEFQQAPNLVVTNFSAPITAISGQDISISYTVENQGRVIDTDWEDGIYFSTDTVLDDNDILLTDIPIFSPEIEPNQSYTLNQNINLAAQAVGNGYLLFKTDIRNDQVESNEDDNVFYPIPITINAPNLVVTNATAPISGSAGQKISLSWTVQNQGQVPTKTRSWYDRIYFSTDNIYSANDIYLTDVWNYNLARLPLDPNESYTITTDITLSSQSAGNGYLLFVTDIDNRQGETNEADNTYAVPITIAAPNLVITSVTAPSSTTAGQTISLSWIVQNQGEVTATASGWYDRIYFSVDNILGNGNDVYIADIGNGDLGILPLASGESYTISQNITLPSKAVGNGYILLQSDFSNSQGESNEQDNVYSVPIVITSPNLVITNATFSSALITGQTVSLSWTVQNQGEVATKASSWADRISFSVDDIFGNSDDVYIRDIWTSPTANLPLDPNESYTVTQNITLPNRLVGNGYLLFSADNFNLQGESNENDNVYVLAVNIQAPNLTISNPTPPPASAIVGQTIAVSWQVTNTGTVSAVADWSDAVYISDDQIWDSSDTYVTQVFTGANTPLSAGSNYIINRNIVVPQTKLGDRYLLFVTDYDKNQGETNEADNVVATPINITAPDLIVSAATTPQIGVLNQTINVSWTVTNQGNVAANADWYDSIYISNDQIFDSSDRYLTSRWAGSNTPLAAGASYNATENITLPNTDIGDRYLLFVADNYFYSSRDYQGETDETNNVRAVPINLKAPDLVVSQLTAPTNGIANGNINVSWQVTNQGEVNAFAKWYDAVYLSTDNIFGNGDDYYITSQYISSQTPLAAGSSYSINRNLTLPNRPAGDYYLLLVADGSGYQGETNENNNVRVVPITISVPDLTVTAATAPASGTLGQAINVSWTVANSGTVTAPADWTDRIYFSTDVNWNSSDTLVYSESITSQTPLAAGTNYTINRNITLPNQAPAGSGYLLFVTDATSSQGESSETNNVKAVPFTVNAPNLVVTSVTSPGLVPVGATINVSWTVANQGAVSANADWYDTIYISNDTIFDSSDQYLTVRSAANNTPLAAGASYTATENITLPNTEIGDRYLLFVADDYIRYSYYDNNLQGETNETDNVYAVPISISSADLVVESANVSGNLVLGSTVELTWKVKNQGTGVALKDWYDYVYISSDQTLSDSDTLVTSESIRTQTPLAAGASYTISKNVTLPSTTTGNRYLLFVADRDNNQGETNENNNVRVVPINLTAPDLVISSVTTPATASLGNSFEVSWTVKNQGTTAAPTDWYDRIYISNDPTFDSFDTLVAEEFISTQTPLNINGEYTITRNITIPNTVLGNRYLLFVADSSQNQGETDESNNVRSVAINLNAPDLVVSNIIAPLESRSGQSVDVSWTITNQGTVAASGGWADRVYLVNASTGAYVSDLGVFSLADTLAPGASLERTQSVNIPLNLLGNYRVVVTTDYVNNIPEGTQNETNNTTTDDRPIQIRLSPVPNLPPLITGFPQGTSGSNKGKTTIIIAGQNFSSTDLVSLIADNGTKKAASKVYWVSDRELWATFDLQGLTTGKYDVSVKNDDNSFVSNDAFTVTNGAVGNIQVKLSYPARGFVTATYTNVGQTDLTAPLFRVSATNAQVNFPEENTASATLRRFLNLTLGTSNNGPAAILAPGESGQFSFNYTPNGNGVIKFLVEQVPANETIDWARIKAESRADYSFIDADAWDAIWSNLTAALGQTVGEFQAVIAKDANYLSQLGQPTSDLTRLFAFEWKQAANTLTNVSLTSTTDVVDNAPGLSLTFGRTFYQSLAERYNLGSLGRGWASQWDLRATKDSQGNVIIRSIGDLQRVFQLQDDGTYSKTGGATLTINNNGEYRLKESNGTVFLFAGDGKFSYIQDTNGNRITLQYTNNRLTRLVHSNGDSLILSYNAQGRISEITDSTGKVTTYSYDTAGEHLLSVTTTTGTTTYTYNTGNLGATKHSLLSISSDEGYQRSFEYDNQGRLSQESSNGQTQTVTYSYDSVGGVTITDGIGATTTSLLNDRGNVSQFRDVKQENYLYRYDADGNLRGITLPDGSQYAYSYDSSGNLTQITDALGQKTNFTYDTTFNQLTGFTDPKGNGVNYSYDSKNNLTKITYADGSSQSFGVDALGNITSYVNRRGNTIQYIYNPDGLLTKKQYANGSSVIYGYDTRGNLSSITDTTGTTTIQYNSADLVTQITYPSGRSLQYSYNSDSQRTRMVTQDGYTVNYSYDAVGRLQTLTDGAGKTIISYEYDPVGRLSKETNGNGTYTTYEYCKCGQPNHIVNYNSDGTVNSRFDYTYDDVGRRTSMTTLEGTFEYGYDATGQLTTVVTPDNRIIQYQYDAAGNRIGVTDNGATTNYSSNNLNQYTSVGNAVYTYDTDGNLISKTQGGQTSTYSYDVENRLIKVVTPQGTWDYEYDGLGNRVATVFNGQRTEYLIDPSGLGDVVGEFDGNGNLVARYNHGIGLVSRIDGSNVADYYDADALGSTVGLTGNNGSYVNRYSYLPFGEDLTKVEGVANPFEYVGQWGVMDEGNGLDFMRARFYDSNLGRFTVVDPINLIGGDTNFYTYVLNSPSHLTDPRGLTPVCPSSIYEFGWESNDLPPTWIPYNNRQVTISLGRSWLTWSFPTDSTVFHGNDIGFVENRIPTDAFWNPSNRQGECFYNPENGKLVKGGTPDAYDAVNDPIKHFFLDPGGPLLYRFVEVYESLKNLISHSGGDVHLKTFDGIHYDLQSVGEFTLLKSTTDDLEIQTRQQPWGSRTDVSVNTAVAVKLNGQRIGFYLNQTQPLVINGTATNIPDGAAYAIGQNLIVREGDTYTIVSANNDLIQVRFQNSYLNIAVGLADNRQGNIVGLLGNNNDNTNDDFALRDSTVIGGSITNQQLYGDYANSWRITQADSLFDYAAGTDTNTFTDLTFPRNIVTVNTLTPEQRAAAEAIARAAGITDPNLLEDAILDIALTNNAPEFIQGYTALQRQETLNAANTLINPDGFATQHWLTASAVIPYTIRFSNNAAQGTTPIAQVTITQQLDSDLDFKTFTLNDFSFGNISVDVPQGVQNYSQRLDLRSTCGVFVDIVAGLNADTGVVTWTFTAIDPATGNPATGNLGFLPPNDQNGAGRGVVGYSIQSKANSTTGTRIDAQATITLGNQTPIQTAAVFNTLDANLPTSQVTALPTNSNSNFIVSWAGSDTGSGLATYDIFVSTDGGQFVPWQVNTTATSATYIGQAGRNYAFYSVATDNLGQREVAPTQPDAVTAILAANNAPTVQQAIVDQTAPEDSTFSFQIPANTFIDVDAGDILTYTATLENGAILPSWLSFNTTTRTFSGTPSNSEVGTLNIKVNATDKSGASVSDIFTLTVANTNDAPILGSAIADQTIGAKSLFSFTLPANTFTDIDAGDSLTYKATLVNDSPLPSWLTFNPATSTFSGTPSLSDVGIINIKVVATDSQGAIASDIFTINIRNLTGTSGKDTITGTLNNDLIEGLAGDDTLVGLAGDDTLDGGSGKDTMTGGLGDDIYIVDNSGDKVVENANEGIDTVRASISYTLGENVENLILTGTRSLSGTGNALNNLITGNSGGNILKGDAGNDTLDGGAGNDTLDGGVGDDLMIGGAGNDIYYVDSSNDQITEAVNEGTDTVRASVTWTLGDNLENLILTGNSAIDGTGNALKNSITGNSADNNLFGGDNDDTLKGDAGNDTLDGGAGNDTLDGGVGDDLMIGGIGNDTYYVDSINDQIVELAHEGTDTVRSAITWVLGDNLENLVLTGSKAIDGTGNALRNSITGNSGDNSLSGGDDNDTLKGNAGNDTLDGGAGNDTLDGGVGDDLMIGGTGNDTYYVDSINDQIVELANEGTDTVRTSVTWTLGDNLENLILTGADTINGTGNALRNNITGNSANNLLFGGDDIDTLKGNDGDDTLDGGNGNDTLTGGNGNDTLIGGLGSDRLTGGAGNDRFVFNSLTEGTDTITDFSSADDVLVVTVLLANLNYTGTNPIANGYIRGIQSGSNTLIQVDADGVGSSATFSTLVTLNNFTASNFSQNNLIF
ncbi:YD repeat-containing protein (plasmid) [Nostoc sp. HK-01]|nr:YD repeat-containing protein [Nostoc sp. HK-01]